MPEEEITAIIGPPDFLTGCEVTGDLAALVSGESARLTLRARITIDEGNRQLAGCSWVGYDEYALAGW